jgi:hypothetical protein
LAFVAPFLQASCLLIALLLLATLLCAIAGTGTIVDPKNILLLSSFLLLVSFYVACVPAIVGAP